MYLYEDTELAKLDRGIGELNVLFYELIQGGASQDDLDKCSGDIALWIQAKDELLADIKSRLEVV